MSKRRINILTHSPAVRSQKPPLLFVHGGYVDARCWRTYFLPYFANHGYDCHALDLSGHGGSDGRESIDMLSLDDYLADVVEVIGTLRSKPVLIGHSMGAFLVERALEEGLGAAAVLMSPLPPSGTIEAATNLFLSYPQFLFEVSKMTRGVFDENSLRLLKQVYFTPETKAEVVLLLAQLVQPESLRAIYDMALLCWRWPPKLPELPVLVVGGEHDTLFPPYMTRRVAKRWQAALQIVPGAGHAMILDQHWQACAAGMLGWLQQLEARLPMTFSRLEASALLT